jgi:hypothetical protein
MGNGSHGTALRAPSPIKERSNLVGFSRVVLFLGEMLEISISSILLTSRQRFRWMGNLEKSMYGFSCCVIPEGEHQAILTGILSFNWQ